MKQKTITYLVTVDSYNDKIGTEESQCDFVDLNIEDDVGDVKDAIREALYIPIGTPIKIISMCPMLHLDLNS